ncbi:MAG TPA: hypothetical protein DHV28_12305 [Ignavibacteriales bacterium]|nr:hypothetical protein [Ignavibacteriales bacterium]
MIQAGDYQKEFMKNSNFIFQITIFLLSISILLTGCHSFYEVPKEDYNNLERMNDIKVVYKNGKEFVIEKDDTTNVKIVGDSLVVYQGTEEKLIGMSEVEKIRESRFDLGGTITISIVLFTVFLVLFLSSDPFKT